MNSASNPVGVLAVVLVAVALAAPAVAQSTETATPADYDASIETPVVKMPAELYEGDGATASVLVENADTRMVDVFVVLYVEDAPIAMRPTTLEPGQRETVSFPAAPAALVENQRIAPGTAAISPGNNYTWSFRIGAAENGAVTSLDGVSNDTYVGPVALNDATVTREFRYVAEDRATAIAAKTVTESSAGAAGDSATGTTGANERDVTDRPTGANERDVTDRDTASAGVERTRQRGFFSNDSESSVSSFTLTVGGFVLSLVGILYEMLKGG